jgi:hypothetical protein
VIIKITAYAVIFMSEACLSGTVGEYQGSFGSLSPQVLLNPATFAQVSLLFFVSSLSQSRTRSCL